MVLRGPAGTSEVMSHKCLYKVQKISSDIHGLTSEWRGLGYCLLLYHLLCGLCKMISQPWPQVLCMCDSHLLNQCDVDFVTEHKGIEGSTLVWSGVNTCYGPLSARKRKGIWRMSSRPLKNRVIPSAPCRWIARKMILNIKGIGAIQTGMPHKCHLGITGRVTL